MGYFTETVSLFETKSEIATANAYRVSLEKNTHRHNGIGKEFSKYASPSYRDRGCMEPMRTKSDYKSREKEAEMDKRGIEFSLANDRRSNIAHNSHIEKEYKEKKLHKESFSEAFDSVVL